MFDVMNFANVIIIEDDLDISPVGRPQPLRLADICTFRTSLSSWRRVARSWPRTRLSGAYQVWVFNTSFRAGINLSSHTHSMERQRQGGERQGVRQAVPDGLLRRPRLAHHQDHMGRGVQISIRYFLPRPTSWTQLRDKWPANYWDDWMRMSEQRQNRTCIRPEISRSQTFGRIGVSKGQFYDSYLQYIRLNDVGLPRGLSIGMAHIDCTMNRTTWTLRGTI